MNPLDTIGYLQKIFEPGDFLDIKYIHQTDVNPATNRKLTRDNFRLLDEIAADDNFAKNLIAIQDKGWNVYVCMNAMTPGVNRRLKKNVKDVRNVYLDIDADGQKALELIRADVQAVLVPRPNFIVQSSPGKFYVVWTVEEFDVQAQEGLLKGLQVRYGADAQVVDVNRVLRLPGTRNLKYPEQPVVEIIESYEGDHFYLPEEFKVEYTVKQPVNHAADPEAVRTRVEYFEQACEDAGVDICIPREWEGCYLYEVVCPQYETHTHQSKTGSCVIIHASGRISYQCKHNHCKDVVNWKDTFRPWMEHEALENGFTARLKFGDPPADGPTGSETVIMSQTHATGTPGAPAASTQTTETVHLRPMTDLGNAERFIDRFGDVVRYCDETGKWFTWNDKIWVRTGKCGPQGLMQQTVRAIPDEAPPEVNEDLRGKLAKWAKKSENNTVLSGSINQARGMHTIHIRMNEFDTDPFLLNFDNGAYNLKDHTFRSHEKLDYITKISPVIYRPDADCPQWQEYLKRCVPCADTRRFLQQAAGYSLTGDASMDCLFLNIGPGRNGKGTFINTLKYVLGTYAMQANFESFIAQKGGGGISIRSDIARLAGARCVVASENDQDQRLAEGLLKNLTGSDAITSRKLYEEEQEYIPQFKLWFGVNNEPRIIGTDEGIWSRIHLVRWNVVIPSEERNANLKHIFATKEASGIINWMLEGLKDFQKNGLMPSEEMKQDYSEFRTNSDQIQVFLQNECNIGSNLVIPSGTLYTNYKSWAENSKEFVLKERQFKACLEAKGFKSKRTTQGIMWYGLRTKGYHFKPTEEDKANMAGQPVEEENEQADVPF